MISNSTSLSSSSPISILLDLNSTLSSSTPSTSDVGIINNITTTEIPCSSNNCTCNARYDRYYPMEIWVLGIFALPVILFGIAANITSVRIFTHRIMASSSINWYLAVLSASDTIILFSAFFVLALPRFGDFFSIWSANYISYSLTPYMYPIMMTAQTCSVYMTIGVSVHRYIGVCHPYKTSQWLPADRVTIFIILLAAFSGVFNLPRFFEVRVGSVCYRPDIDYHLPLVEMTDLRRNPVYHLIYNVWINMFVMYALPFTLLIGFNTCVLFAVRKSRKAQVATQCGIGDDEFSRRANQKERQTSIMLVSIVIIFIACNTLSLVCNLFEIWQTDNVILEYTVLFNNCVVLINASSNITIYMLFSDKYRALLHYYMGCNWSRKGELLVSSTVT